MRRTIGFTAAVILFSISPSPAKDAAPPPSIREALSGVPRAELPAKVAEMILTAKAENRKEVTLSAVKMSIRLNRPAAPMIVGTSAKAAPELAADLAAVAAREQPKQAVNIARAAAVAAPAEAGRIVLEVCRVTPNQFRNIAVSVAQAVPTASKEILDAVSVVFPELKQAIETALEATGGKPASVGGILDSASLLLASDRDLGTPGAALARGGTADKARVTRPPFIPLSGNKSSAADQPSGRNYATP